MSSKNIITLLSSYHFLNIFEWQDSTNFSDDFYFLAKDQDKNKDENKNIQTVMPT